MSLFSRTIVLALVAASVAACSDGADRARADSAVVLGGSPAPGTRQLPMATAIDVTIQDSITSKHNKVGDEVSAILSRNVLDDSGRVAIPAGATAALRVAALHGATGENHDAVVTLDVVGITDGGTTYTPVAAAGRVSFALRAGKRPADDRTLVVVAGTPITIRLTQALGIAAK